METPVPDTAGSIYWTVARGQAINVHTRVPWDSVLGETHTKRAQWWDKLKTRPD